jgi:urease accessory protein
MAATTKAWPTPSLALLRSAHDGPVAYPVAVGVAAAGHGVPLGAVCPAFALSVVANLVSAAVRLGGVGQTDGQRVIAALLPAVEKLAREAESATLDDLGACVFRSDLAALRHETQYTRLFRT